MLNQWLCGLFTGGHRWINCFAFKSHPVEGVDYWLCVCCGKRVERARDKRWSPE